MLLLLLHGPVTVTVVQIVRAALALGAALRALPVTVDLGVDRLAGTYLGSKSD